MAEATGVEGYNIISHLGKGKALMGVKVTVAASDDTITTPFIRCVAVVTPGDATVGAAAIPLFVVESAGVITIDANDAVGPLMVLIYGDLY